MYIYFILKSGCNEKEACAVGEQDYILVAGIDMSQS